MATAKAATRQKEKALDSMTEVVQTIRHRKSQVRDSVSNDVMVKPDSATTTPGRQAIQSDESSMSAKTPGRVSTPARSKSKSLSSNKRHEDGPSVEPEELMLSTEVIELRDSWDRSEREKDIRQGIDLATTLERIEKNFVISDPRLPDNPIIFASDSFLELTEYTREEILGRNCRFLQGPETDQSTVQKIRDAIRDQREITVQLINYTKSGKKFWNLFHLQPMRDQKGELQYFIGVQLDGSDHVEPIRNRLSERTEMQSSKLVKATATNVDEAVRELPDANMIQAGGETVGLHHFKPVKPLGSGDTGRYYLHSRQTEKALDSMTEVVQTIRHRKSQVRDSVSNDVMVKPDSATTTPGRQAIQSDEASKSAKTPERVSTPARSKSKSLSSNKKHEDVPSVEPEELMLSTEVIEPRDSWDRSEREKDIRQGIDLATTLERIEKNFVISDPRLPDNPIIFASDSFLELTEYTREEILGRNCRFLQGPETDQSTVQKIRDAIRDQREITVQLINYTKSGKKFWNLFHLQPMRDQKGELQYFIGVQLDGSDHVEPIRNRLSERTEMQSSKLVKATATNVDEAVRELPDANMVRYTNS
ncbi:hypothetical protein F2Q68_00000887 [Brassica cretica]|uniref:LOV domain-containing protein n=1 Tax=Brassica cretica TaxID=69181 RepID=A0A8S9JKL4_BRACR|nr:hypothetical protein F2Q68_00000887 [Brassica cretica]